MRRDDAMKCINCGCENLADSKFCENCGAMMSEQNQQMQAQTHNSEMVYQEVQQDNQQQPKKSNKGLKLTIIVIIILIVLGTATAVAYKFLDLDFLGKGKQETRENEDEFENDIDEDEEENKDEDDRDKEDVKDKEDDETEAEEDADGREQADGRDRTNTRERENRERPELPERQERPELPERPESEDEIGTAQNEYILSGSERRLLTMEDIQDLTVKELNYAKNEIYARRGRKFKDEELQKYFDSKSWYQGTTEPEDFKEDVFNEIEKVNIEFLSNAEKNQ